MATVTPTEEKADCFRLQLLIVDVGTDVLRHLLDQKVQPKSLKDFLNSVKGKLDELFKKKVISKEQWDLLFPTILNEPDIETFDISLICCLLLNVCGLKIRSPNPRWIPPSMDTSKEADIIRLRNMRNEIAHLRDLSYNKNNFQMRWQEMEQVMLRLGAGIPDLQQKISSLRNEVLDPAKAKEYQKKIEEWEEMDKTTQNHIDEINSKLKKTEDEIDEVKRELKNTNTTSTEIDITVKNHEMKLDNFEEKQKEQSTRIDELDIETVEQRSTLSSMELKQKTLEEEIRDTSVTLTTIAKYKLSPRLQNLTSITELYTEDCARDNLYVETSAHEKAKEILTNTGCVILIGPPGEGKTTMATKLMSETSKKGSCLKLSLPSDWDTIDINKGIFDTIFIDDMFGAGALDENLLNDWSLRCKDMEKAVQAGVIRIIITTRHYIFFEAQLKLRKCSLFKEKNIQLLASFNLTESERMSLIENHLRVAGKKIGSGLVQRCSREYVRAFTNPTLIVRLPDNIRMYLYKGGQIPLKAMIGFPEIVSLFSRNEDLFRTGSYFFSNPDLFFKKCIEEIFVDAEKFLILILIWTRPDKELHLKSIQPHNISEEIKQTALKFGIDFKGKIFKVLLESVKYHNSGFIQYDQKRGICSFTHNTVKDMVGLVAGQYYPYAVLEFADEQFLKKYVTTKQTKDDGFHILVNEHQYDELVEAICKHMEVKQYMPFLCFTDKKRDFEIRSNFGRAYIDFSLPGELNINTSILSHDCFDDLTFVKMFLESECGRLFFMKPVDILPFICIDRNCDIIFGENPTPVFLPSLALLYKHKFLLEVFVEQKEYQALNKTSFLRTSLLIASHQGMKDIIKLLLKYGAVVCGDAIHLASAKGHYESLQTLLENRGTKNIDHSSSLSRSSPLVVAAKGGNLQCIELLLQNHADINYRNKNGWSALDKAILGYQSETCKVLLKHNANVNCKAGKNKRTPLHISADKGKKEITEILLKHGASVTSKDYKGHNPIHCAAFQGWTDVVELLLNADVERVTCKQRISYKETSVIRGAELFHIAVYKKDYSLVDLLLKFELNPNVKDFYGQTPIYRAICNFKQHEMDSSSDRSEDSFGPIMKEVMDVIFKARPVKTNCSRFANMQIIKSLLPVADVGIPDRHGYTPLHAAVHKGLKDVVELLCPKVNVNARDRYGKTPLHTACEQLDLEIFKLLVEEFKADYRMITKSGQSIFDILEKKTSWKSICRRYKDKKPVKSHMLEKPPFKSFRDVIAAMDPEFAEQKIHHYSKQSSDQE